MQAHCVQQMYHLGRMSIVAETVQVWGHGLEWEIFVPSAQFGCESLKQLLNTLKEGRHQEDYGLRPPQAKS
jgi:hypothetical protein